MNSDDWPQGYEGPGIDQARRIARDTTPAQRIDWLEDMLQMLWRSGLLPNKFAEPDPMRD